MFNWAQINLITFLSLRFSKISFGSPVWADSVDSSSGHSQENKSYGTAWTYIWIPALREVDWDLDAKRGADRTKTLVSLY